MANKRISELSSRTPSATDLMLVGDPTTGYSYKCLVSQVGGVTSVFGRTGAVTAQEGDYSLTSLSDVTITSPASGDILTYNGSSWINSAGGFVPYTGATANVSLGEYGILAGWYRLDTTPTGTPTNQGTIYWDDSFNTAAIIMNGTTQEIGHDQFYQAKNSTGTTIPKGTAVRFAGTDGGSGHLLITPFLADGSNPSSYFMGVTAEAITNGSFGKVQSFGRLDGIDTSAFAEGDILYASTTVAGGFQTTVPVAPNNIVQVAAVVSDAVNGKLLIRPTLGSKLTSDESVKITSVANGNVLQYNSTLSVWENVAPSSLAVSNIYTANGTLTGNRTVTMGGNNLTFTGGNIAFGTTVPSPVQSAPFFLFLGVGGVISGNATGTTTELNLASNVYFDGTNSRYRQARPAAQIYMGNDGHVQFLTYPTGTVGGVATGTERMRVFNTGNIGINTTTDAGFRLNVNGTAQIGAALTVANAGILTGTGQIRSEAYFNAKGGSTTPETRFRAYGIGRPDGGFGNAVMGGMYGFFSGASWPNGFGLAFYTSEGADISGGASATEKMTILANGNVGIGTTSPTYKLHVVGTSRITGNTEFSTASGAYMIIGAAGDTSYRLSVDGDLRVYGNIRTAQPTGGTGVGVWRLGSTATGTFTLDTTTCVEIEIGGSLVKIATVS